MRAVGVALLALLSGCAAPQVAGLAGCEGPLRVRNAAPVAVEQLYLRAAGAPGWGRDLLAPGTLAPGAATEQPVPAGGRVDLRAVFVDGRAAERAGLDACAASEVVIGAAR